MSKFCTILQLKSEPPHEMVTVNTQGNTISYKGLPAMVAFDLANIYFDEQSEGDTSTFLNKYWVRTDELKTTSYRLSGSQVLKTDLLDEAIRMKGFIENILLTFPTDYPALEKVSKHKRTALHIKTNKLADILENRFNKVMVSPFFYPEDSIGKKKMAPEEKMEYYNKVKSKLIKNLHDDKVLKEFSKFFSFAWKYESDDLLDIGWLELLLLAEADITVKHCKRCQEFFIPSPPNALHCPKCRDNYTPQELYRYRKTENMSEKEKVENRKWRSQYMQEYRRKIKEIKEEQKKKQQEDYSWRSE
jgi:DNA-directed RNA polymerase subunit M/transcription elongation factor TFIIS